MVVVHLDCKVSIWFSSFIYSCSRQGHLHEKKTKEINKVCSSSSFSSLLLFSFQKKSLLSFENLVMLFDSYVGLKISYKKEEKTF